MHAHTVRVTPSFVSMQLKILLVFHSWQKSDIGPSLVDIQWCSLMLNIKCAEMMHILIVLIFDCQTTTTVYIEALKKSTYLCLRHNPICVTA